MSLAYSLSLEFLKYLMIFGSFNKIGRAVRVPKSPPLVLKLVGFSDIAVEKERR